MKNILEVKNITKKFGKVVAVNNASLDLREGEILSILGENGSGKTTLMNMIAGIYYPDEGNIFINGVEESIRSPKDAFRLRIGMIHQHFKLVDIFTATQNIVLGLNRENYKEFRQAAKESEDEKFAKIKAEGREPTKAEINNYKRLMRSTAGYNLKESKKRIIRISQKFGFTIDPDKKVYNMSVSEKQTLEIVKVLYRGCDILILDEPTAVLTPQEIKQLFKVIKNMRDAGKSIIIITHKLNEVMEISDRIAILRKGEHIATVNTSETNEKELTEMMVGKKIDLEIHRDEPNNPVDRLFINDLCSKNIEGVDVLKHISFTCKGGEILGIAGVAGSGQKELLETISGLRNYSNGSIVFHNPKKDLPASFFHKKLPQIKQLASKNTFYFKGKEGVPADLTGFKNAEIKKMVNNGDLLFFEDEIVNLKNKTPMQIRRLGIHLSFVPEDRLGMGLVGNMDITDNMMLRSYQKGNSVLVNRKKPHDLAETIINDLEVVTPNAETPVRMLSGGNIQKVLVGREISYRPKVLMAAYPVRGLDINSSYAIYDLLNKQKERGTAVIFVGEDLDVMLALCDRIVVMCGGEVSGIVDARTTTKEDVGLLMMKHGEGSAYAK